MANIGDLIAAATGFLQGRQAGQRYVDEMRQRAIENALREREMRMREAEQGSIAAFRQWQMGAPGREQELRERLQREALEMLEPSGRAAGLRGAPMPKVGMQAEVPLLPGMTAAAPEKAKMLAATQTTIGAPRMPQPGPQVGPPYAPPRTMEEFAFAGMLPGQETTAGAVAPQPIRGSQEPLPPPLAQPPTPAMPKRGAQVQPGPAPPSGVPLQQLTYDEVLAELGRPERRRPGQVTTWQAPGLQVRFGEPTPVETAQANYLRALAAVNDAATATENALRQGKVDAQTLAYHMNNWQYQLAQMWDGAYKARNYELMGQQVAKNYLDLDHLEQMYPLLRQHAQAEMDQIYGQIAYNAGRLIIENKRLELDAKTEADRSALEARRLELEAIRVGAMAKLAEAQVRKINADMSAPVEPKPMSEAEAGNLQLRIAGYNAARAEKLRNVVAQTLTLPFEPVGGMIPGMEGQQRFFSEPVYRAVKAWVDTGVRDGWLDQQEAASMRHGLGLRYQELQKRQAPKVPSRRR